MIENLGKPTIKQINSQFIKLEELKLMTSIEK